MFKVLRSPKCSILALSLSLVASPVFAVPESAKQTDSLVESMGVNVHLNYYDTKYTSEYTTFTKPRLQELGIRHIRDVLNPGNTFPGGQAVLMQDLYNTLGIKTALSAGPASVAASSVVNSLKNEYGIAILSFVAGPNEPDINTSQFVNGDWVNGTRDYLQQLSGFVRGDAATANLPIIAPALVRSNSSQLLGNIEAWVDLGNMHPYSRFGPQDVVNQLVIGTPPQWNLPTGNKPMASTEFGYTTCSVTQEDNLVTETVHGKYVPRAFLEHYRIGVVRSWSYELIDLFPDAGCSNNQNHFGMLRNNNTPKPAFTGTKNLISLLKDPGVAFIPAALDYSLTGDTQDVQRLLLQKRDGSFWLVLWTAVNSTDTDQNRTVTVNLASPADQVTSYRSNDSVNPVQSLSNVSQVAVTVPDHPLILKIVPAQVAAQPDLVVTSVGYTPLNRPRVGKDIQFTATITNQGTAPTPAGTIMGVGFFFASQGSNYYFNDTFTQPLQPGESVTLTSLQPYVLAQPGTLTIQAVVDDVNRIGESNESNNDLSQSFTVSP